MEIENRKIISKKTGIIDIIGDSMERASIKDKRRKILKVMPKGEKIAEKILDYDEKWDEKIKKNLSGDEYDDFLIILKKICMDLI